MTIDDFIELGPQTWRHKDTNAVWVHRADQTLQDLIDEIHAPQTVDLRAYASEARWRKETGGFDWSGIHVPSDDRAKLLLLGAAQTLADEVESPLIISGVRYGSITGAQFRLLNATLVEFVQSTFDTLSTVLAGVDNGTITSTAQIDAAFS